MELEKYRKRFTEGKFWQKVKKVGEAAGAKTVYTALLLYYAYHRKETPTWAKSMVLGVLGYFIAPIDAIPDITFLVGYTDDFGLLSMALVTIAAYVNEDVRGQARAHMDRWFGSVDEAALAQVDEKL